MMRDIMPLLLCDKSGYTPMDFCDLLCAFVIESISLTNARTGYSLFNMSSLSIVH